MILIDEMCREPAEMMHRMHRMQRHVELPGDAMPLLAEQLSRAPDYGRPPFSRDEQRLIRSCTGGTAARFGYGWATGDAPAVALPGCA